MLLFAAFLAVTGSAQAGARVVVVHEGEMLRSEQHFMAALKKSCGTATIEEATPSEAAFVRDGGALPESWNKLATVVVISLVPPVVDKKGQRFSRGLGGVLVFHPPSATPVDCPMNRLAANSATLLPRCSGAICVAFTCSVLCSM